MIQSINQPPPLYLIKGVFPKPKSDLYITLLLQLGLYYCYIFIAKLLFEKLLPLKLLFNSWLLGRNFKCLMLISIFFFNFFIFLCTRFLVTFVHSLLFEISSFSISKMGEKTFLEPHPTHPLI